MRLNQVHAMKKMHSVFLLSLVLLILQYLEHSDASEGCSGRVVLNSTNGYISDGVGNYPAPSHCEWLIDGKFMFVVVKNVRFVYLLKLFICREISHMHQFMRGIRRPRDRCSHKFLP